MFNERKVAQMAAFFLDKRGDQMSHLKLMKMLYLADRESLRVHGISMSGDCMVSMPHGPVLSMTLNLMDGDTKAQPDGWDRLVSDKANYELSLKSPILIDDLDELSKADIEILESIWDQFGKMSRWDIRDYTHEHCKEWKDPHGSSMPISFKSLFRAVGLSEAEAEAMAEQIDEQKRIDNLLSAL